MSSIKEQFLMSLANPRLPVNESQTLFLQLNDDDFNPESSERDRSKTKYEEDFYQWDERYFHQQLGLLGSSFFTKKRCEHAMNVKANLQERGIKGFSIKEGASTINGNIDPESKGFNEDINAFLAKNINLLKKFEVDPKLQSALNDEDVEIIKALLMFYINDRNYSVEDALLSILYCYQMAPELFEEYQESKFRKPIDLNKNAWSIDYLVDQQIYLNANFSIERLLHLINILSFLDEKTKQSKFLLNDHEREHYQEHGRAELQQKKFDDSSAFQDKQKQFVKTVVAIGGAVLVGVLLLIAILR